MQTYSWPDAKDKKTTLCLFHLVSVTCPLLYIHPLGVHYINGVLVYLSVCPVQSSLVLLSRTALSHLPTPDCSTPLQKTLMENIPRYDSQQNETSYSCLSSSFFTVQNEAVVPWLKSKLLSSKKKNIAGHCWQWKRYMLKKENIHKHSNIHKSAQGCHTLTKIKFPEFFLCFPCLEEWRYKLPVLPVPWQPCHGLAVNTRLLVRDE